MDCGEDLCHSQVSDEDELEDYSYDSDEIEEENNDFVFVEPTDKKMDNYSVLSEDDIGQRQEEATARVCSILFISKDEAAVLLLHFQWNFQRVVDEWLVKEGDIRRDLGLLEIRVSEIDDPNSEFECGICSETYLINGMNAGICGHYFCNECWLNWIRARIDEAGARCLRLKCLEPSCKCAIGQDMVLNLLIYADQEYLKMYRQYFVRSYVESNRKIKWCPAPGCEYAVEMNFPESGSVEMGNPESGSGSYEVTCKCFYKFCWNCSAEVHSPVDCETVKKWMLKNKDNAETENWKLVNTKPCPKCGSAIEKNNGCMHMTCVDPCRFQFCWICLADWSKHGYDYSCNKYQDEEVGKKRKREKDAAREALERYLHYYERWAANESSREKALSDLQRIQRAGFEKLSITQAQSDSELKFVTNAWLQIVECRRVLKWTYAYGYYLPETRAPSSGFGLEFTSNKQEPPSIRAGLRFTLNHQDPPAIRAGSSFTLNQLDPPAIRAGLRFNLNQQEPAAIRAGLRFNLNQQEPPAIRPGLRFNLNQQEPPAIRAGLRFNLNQQEPPASRFPGFNLNQQEQPSFAFGSGINLVQGVEPFQRATRVSTIDNLPRSINRDLLPPQAQAPDHSPPQTPNSTGRWATKSRANKDLFEHLQAYAESSLERLHHCAEQEFQGFITDKESSQNFNDFRIKLIDLTHVTSRYFQNLIEALEKGLTDG